MDASTDHVGIGTSVPTASLDVSKSAEFNSKGGDNDFQVRGQTVDTLLFVDASTDRVGMGTSVPRSRLHIVGASDVGMILDKSTTVAGSNFMWFDNPKAGATPMRIGTWRGVGVEVEDGLMIQASNAAFGMVTDVAYFGANGRVGLGTTSPMTSLHMRYATDVEMILDKLRLSAGSNFMWFDNPTGTPMRMGTWRGTGTGVQDGFLIQTSNAALGNVKEVAYFGSNNRVGIGTTSPEVSLHVVDTAAVGVILDRSTTVAGNNDIWFDNPTATPMRVGTWRGGGAQDGLLIHASNATFGTDSVVAYFGANGRVGIATTSPTEGLDVRGSAVFNENSDNFDFRIDGVNIDTLFFVDASADHIGIGTGTPDASLDVAKDAVFNAAGQDYDFRIHGDNQDNILFVDANTDRVGIGTNTPRVSFDVAKDAVFNSEGGDNDFTVRGDTRDHVLFVDANTDRVGINTNAPVATLGVNGSVRINRGKGNSAYNFQINSDTSPLVWSSANLNALSIGDASSTETTRLQVTHDSVGVALNRSSGGPDNMMLFKNPTGTPMRIGVGVRGLWIQTANASGAALRSVFHASSSGTVLIGGGGTPEGTLGVIGSTVFNQSGGDNDFRVEGNGDANLLFVDASEDMVQIGTNTAPTAFTSAQLPALHIAHTSAVGVAMSASASTTGNYILFDPSGTSNSMRFGVESNKFRIRNNSGTIRVTIKGATNEGGNMGIGTDNPRVRLHVASGARSTTFKYNVNRSHHTYSGLAVGKYIWKDTDGGHITSDYFDRLRLEPGTTTKVFNDNSDNRNQDALKPVVASFEGGSLEIYSGSLLSTPVSVSRNYSDSRIKKDVKTVVGSKSRETFEKIRLVTYNKIR